MCEVCELEGIDWEFRNGERAPVRTRFYRVYVGDVTDVNLCFLHSIELFRIGETRFLEAHVDFAISLHTKRRSRNDEASMGFF
jgi:hypothetical protein